MIRVTVELLPGGLGPAEHLGTAFITNDGTGTKTKGNYSVWLSQRRRPNTVWREGVVKGFRRKRFSSFHLLFLALKSCIGDEER